MSEKLHIGIYRGTTPDFLPLLSEVRRRMPQATISVIAPPSHNQDEELKPLANRIVTTERCAYRLYHYFAIRRLIRQIRSLEVDYFIVLYDTPQQQLLALCSGAPRAELWGWNQRISPIQTRFSAYLRHRLGIRLRRMWLRRKLAYQAWKLRRHPE